jgi:signal transduction histidine kinase
MLGVMNIAIHQPRRFTHQDVQLLSSIANQITVAIENAALYDEVRRKEEMRGELLHEIISTQEEERKRIARELHDETSQTLTGLSVNLEAVMNALPLDPDQTKAKLEKVQALAIRTLEEIQRVIYELRPSLLDDLGLLAAVNWGAKEYLETAGIQVHLETDGEERRLPAEIETALFRIIQEATTNIVRHSGADSTSITIEYRENSVALRIEDNGKGFEPHQAIVPKNKGRGLGLLSMQERAELLGGELTLQSRPGSGTCITADIPTSCELYHEQDTSTDSR